MYFLRVDGVISVLRYNRVPVKNYDIDSIFN